MKKLLLSLSVGLMLLGIFSPAYGQVSGISYTLSPYGEYTWTGENSGIKDGYTAGAMLGMGFGEFVELRGNYARGIGLTSDISKFGVELSDEQIASFQTKDIDFSRIGGELKLNLSRGAFLPYMTVGTGIQSIGYDSLSTSKQIYLNAGLGIIFSAGDRYTLGLQAINSRYRYNAPQGLLDSEERATYGVDDDLDNKVSNWGLRASLVFYLGGRKPGKLTDIDKAYLDNFSGGFRGLSIPIEPQVLRMNFSEDLPYKDTWMAGGSAGFNFGNLVGIRGFYWRSVDSDDYTKFDDLAMYGGEARFKLNEGRGFTPWITLGGGNIQVGDSYSFADSTDIVIPTNKGFATGGLGIDVPFSKYIKATAFARSVLTTNQSTDEVPNPDAINYSYNYGVSLNFVLGKSKKKIDVVSQTAFDEYILATQSENAEATNELRSQYEDQIKVLEAELSQAIAEQDVEAIEEINSEKEKAEQIVDQLSSNPGMMAAYPGTVGSNQPGEVRMSPAEFNLLIQDILNGTRSNQVSQPSVATAASTQNIDAAINEYKVEQQIASLTKSMTELQESLKDLQEGMQNSNKQIATAVAGLSETMNKELTEMHLKIEKNQNALAAMKQKGNDEATGESESMKIMSKENDRLQRELDLTNDKISNLKDLMIAQNASRNQTVSTVDNTNATSLPGNQISNERIVTTGADYDNSKGFFAKLRYNGMSGFTGINLGGNTTFNVGYRLHYGLKKTDIEIMPETFFGFGSPSSFGISVNGVYKFGKVIKSKHIKPYAGLGLGLLKVGDKTNVDRLTGAWNLIVGTSLNVFAGDLYVDLTARNTFKYNQVIVGYRFPF